MTQSGYHIGRKDGLTARETAMLALLKAGMNHTEAAAQLGISKQRAGQIVKALKRKGKL